LTRGKGGGKYAWSLAIADFVSTIVLDAYVEVIAIVKLALAHSRRRFNRS
jgi:hypothetical protein